MPLAISIWRSILYQLVVTLVHSRASRKLLRNRNLAGIHLLRSPRQQRCHASPRKRSGSGGRLYVGELQKRRHYVNHAGECVGALPDGNRPRPRNNERSANPALGSRRLEAGERRHGNIGPRRTVLDVASLPSHMLIGGVEV